MTGRRSRRLRQTVSAARGASGLSEGAWGAGLPDLAGQGGGGGWATPRRRSQEVPRATHPAQSGLSFLEPGGNWAGPGIPTFVVWVGPPGFVHAFVSPEWAHFLNLHLKGDHVPHFPLPKEKKLERLA